MKQLRDYQSAAITELSTKFSAGAKKLLLQLPTGGGKTVMFCGIINRYLGKNQKRVLVLVHREELMIQARKTLYEWHGIIPELITADVKKCTDYSQVYIAMVETANNRLKKDPHFFPNIGMVIIDECHLGNFNKIYPHFERPLFIGFTATPISSRRDQPLKDFFEDIVCAIDIPDLIENGSLCQNETHRVVSIKRATLRMRNGEFDQQQMADMYSTGKHVDNCVKGYEQFCRNKKTLIFNCNVEHSKLVTDALQLSGYNAKHIDATSADRAELLAWFKVTPNAVLCNIGILTVGFDEPTIECIIVNRATASLPLWLQMAGRGSRPSEGKDKFILLDMGDNAIAGGHHDWSTERDWRAIFLNPKPPSKGDGVAPVKECTGCGALIGASMKICPFCGKDMTPDVEYDKATIAFELLTASKPFKIIVSELIEQNAAKNDYYTLHQIKNKLMGVAKYQWGVKEMNEKIYLSLLTIYQEKVREWCKLKGKQFNQFHKTIPAKWLTDEIQKVFGWAPPTAEQ
jgi:superfamily II DNA or RNA helicase